MYHMLISAVPCILHLLIQLQLPLRTLSSGNCLIASYLECEPIQQDRYQEPQWEVSMYMQHICLYFVRFKRGDFMVLPKRTKYIR